MLITRTLKLLLAAGAVMALLALNGSLPASAAPAASPPVGVADSYSTTENIALTVATPGVLANDSDPGGQPITAVLDHQPYNGGSVVLNADGSFTYTPPADRTVDDVFTYRVSNGSATSELVNAVIHVVLPSADLGPSISGPATAVQDTDATYTFTLTNYGPNDATNVDLVAQVQASVTLVSFTAPAGWSCPTPSTLTECSAPTLASGAAAIFTVVVHIDANNPGEVTAFTNSGSSTSDPGPHPNYTQMTTTVTPPVADLAITLTAPATADAGSNITYVATVHNLGPDRTDNYGTILSTGLPPIVSIDAPPGWTCDRSGGACNTTGYVDAGATLTFTFLATVPAGFSGTLAGAASVRNSADPNTANDIARVDTMIGAGPAGPVAVDDTYSTPQGGFVDAGGTGGLLANDSGVSPSQHAFLQAAPAQGAVTIRPDNSFRYEPFAAFAGTDTFTYCVTAAADSGPCLSNVATVTVTVLPAEMVVARPDAYSTPASQTLTVPAPGVLANDSAPTGTSIHAVLADTVTHGSVVLQADGSFVYTPNAGFSGTDTFSYIASNTAPDLAARLGQPRGGAAPTDTATVTITVTPLATVARDDSYTTAAGTPLVVGVPGLLANDDPPPGLAGTALIGAPTHGTAVVAEGGSFTYTPSSGFTGTDTFTYCIATEGCISNVATATVTVSPATTTTTTTTTQPTPTTAGTTTTQPTPTTAGTTSTAVPPPVISPAQIGSPPAPAPAPPAGGVLPRTGTNLSGPTALGLALVSAGVALVGVARRRRTEA